MERSLQSYRNGQLVQFGVLGVSGQGLHHNNRIYPWEQVHKIRLENSYVRISPQRIHVMAATVANLDVFLALLSTLHVEVEYT